MQVGQMATPSSSNRPSTSASGHADPQEVQLDVSIEPWTSITRRLPARR
jgi:hypothetical protein